MNTEIFSYPQTISGKNNNNPPLPTKKWSTSSIPGLVSVDESIESIVTEQNVENIERNLGGRERCSRENSLTDIKEDHDVESEEPDPTPYRLNRSRHNSIVGIVKSFGSREKRGSLGLEDKRGRRKSWHSKFTHLPKEKMSKNERKRRPGVIEPTDESREDESGSAPMSPVGYDRHKRKSWWNIFVPEEFTQKSRRASTDVGRPVFPVPYVRNKSRSVDHGISSPFDLDLLRSKVEDRFDSVADSDGDTDREKKKVTPPINTIPYTVQASDTLNSVAARFDITPSELRKLNRLASNLIFPGQLIHVPEKKSSADGEENADDTLTSISTSEDGEHEPPPEEKDILEYLRPVSPKPGHIERVKTPMSPQAKRHDPREARFLKINVRHITDGQGVVGGVLLVTPNAVMFDPNVSDPLVIEHGPESYGVIAPMEFVVNAAIYYDIAHMRVGHTDNKTDCVKPEIYYSKSNEKDKISLEPQGSPGRDSLLVKDETFPELAPGKGSSDEDNESISSYAGREGDAFPKAFERDLVTPTNLDTTNTTTPDNNNTTTSESTLVSQKSCPETGGDVPTERRFDERRTSSLDQHWAVPKQKSNSDSTDSQSDSDKIQMGESAQGIDDGMGPEKVKDEEESDERSRLTKLSCHDSGIDIRDTSTSGSQETPVVAPTKKVVRDADIVLSPKNECVLLVSNPEPKKKTSSVSFSVEEDSKENKEEKEDEKSSEGKKSKMLKRLSYPLSWMEGTFVNESKDSEKDSLPSLPTSADSQHSSVFSKVFSRRSSVGTFIRNSSSGSSDQDSKGSLSRNTTPKLDYRSMVSVEDMPELFVSFEKLIPRPARSCEDPPLYLRLRMGKPIDKKIPKSTPIMSYGKKKMRPEYWFSVPRNRVDDLYNFLHVWVPHLYGDLDEMDPKARGYELVESDTELWDDEETTLGEGTGEPGEGDDLTDLTRESWEVLSMSEELRRALYASSVGSLDMDMFVPDLVGTTEILTEEHRKQLCRHLPARAEGYLWTLVFSTSQHGFSLNSLYRKMSRLESPILLVIQDTDNNVFGALTSCSLKVSDHFYGTGESMLFKFNPEFCAYQWTGDNMYFIKGNNESLAIGAGDGKFGLWLDGDLYQGRSERCTTYDNAPLSSQEDFVVKTLECWAFI